MFSLKRFGLVCGLLLLILGGQWEPLRAQGTGPRSEGFQRALVTFVEEGRVDVNRGEAALQGLAPDVREAVAEALHKTERSQGPTLNECGPCPNCCALRVSYRTLRDRNGRMVAFFYQIVKHCWVDGVLTAAEVVTVDGWTYDPAWVYLGIYVQGSIGGVGEGSYTSGVVGKFGYWDGTQYAYYAYPQSYITISGNGGNWATYGDDTVP